MLNSFAPAWLRQGTSLLTIAALLVLSVAVAIPQTANAAFPNVASVTQSSFSSGSSNDFQQR